MPRFRGDRREALAFQRAVPDQSRCSPIKYDMNNERGNAILVGPESCSFQSENLASPANSDD